MATLMLELKDSPCRYMAFSVLDQKIYLFGGWKNGKRTNDLLIFDINQNKLEKQKTKGNLPNKRRRHGSVALNSSLFIFGG